MQILTGELLLALRGARIALVFIIVLLVTVNIHFLYGSHAVETIGADATLVDAPRHSVSSTSPRVLLYITTHLSEGHLRYFEECWPASLARTTLLRNGSVLVYAGEEATEATLRRMDRALGKLPVASARFVHEAYNPGRQAGATYALQVALRKRWFDGYDWIVRVNPDVIIADSNKLEKLMSSDLISAVFADCKRGERRKAHSDCNFGKPVPKIHTDFFAVRPSAIPAGAFDPPKSPNAECAATAEFLSLVEAGSVAWLPNGVTNKRFICHMEGSGSGIVHTHQEIGCPALSSDNATALSTGGQLGWKQRSDPPIKLVMFVTPTRGRETLANTIRSLQRQALGPSSWGVVVVSDDLQDAQSAARLSALAKLNGVHVQPSLNKLGLGRNSAGLVRNVAMQLDPAPFDNTWIAFVDDDDVVSHNYTRYLDEHMREQPEADLVIFRMTGPRTFTRRHWAGGEPYLPTPGDKRPLQISHVGISFAIRSAFVKKHELYMQPSATEDLNYLNRAKALGAKILVSRHVAYYVRTVEPPAEDAVFEDMWVR